MSEANGNAADYFIERHLREGRGERLAFTDPWRSLSYAQLSDASARFAAGLAKAGIERERRIALLMLDTIDFPIAFWGALRAGIVPVPINTLLPADITEYILRDSRAAALVVSAPLLDPLRPVLDRLPALKQVVVSEPNGEPSYHPKATGFAAFLDSAAPTGEIAECSPDEVLATRQRFQPTIFAGVPTLYAALLAQNAIGPGAGSDRLRRCISAGEPLPEHIGRRWREVVGSDILDGLGSTEMLHIFLSNRPDDIRYGTTGKPVPPYEVRIGHAAVLEAAVVGHPDPEGLIKPKAFVVLQQSAPRDDPDALCEALQSHVKEQIGVWKYPRWIEFCDNLPKTATGKIQRYKLRQ